MAAYPNFHNPFAGVDEDDDEREVAREKRGFKFDDGAECALSPVDLYQRRLEQEVMYTAQSAVDSSNRSIGLICDSEKIGTETAEELVRQGQVLKRVERMVDTMEQDMRASQRHLNSIKSVWGGLVNYFKGKPEPKLPQKEQPKAHVANSRLQNALEESIEHQDKYKDCRQNLGKLDTPVLEDSSSLDNGISNQKGYPKNRHLKAAHQQLDHNLDEMSKGLSRLKNLGLGLQAEIYDQDVSLDSLLNKVDSMEGKISATNSQLKNLK